MCNELYALYESFEKNKKNIIASGGAIRNIEILKTLIADRFGVPVYVNATNEEAATEAALYSAFVVGEINYNNGFSEYISFI